MGLDWLVRVLQCASTLLCLQVKWLISSSHKCILPRVNIIILAQQVLILAQQVFIFNSSVLIRAS